MGIKKGTKLTETPKNKMLRIRVDEDTEKKLNALCRHKNKSKSEIVRDGIDKQYAELKE